MIRNVKLVGTPLSHFARKVRVLLDLYQQPYAFEDIGNVAFTKLPSDAGGNPMLRVPVLHIGDDMLIESDHIASYLVDRLDADHDRYEVLSRKLSDLNVRAIINGVMNEEVKLIVAGRHQLETEGVTYFEKSRASMQHGLQWLEQHHRLFLPEPQPKYRDLHLVCLWDHLAYYGNIVDLTPYRCIQEKVLRINETCPALQLSSPWVLKPK